VRFTLLDVHQDSVDSVAAIVASLDLTASVEAIVRADAAEWAIPEGQTPDVILFETMNVCLEREPQVAIARNLVPQAPGAILVPRSVRVVAALVDLARERPPVTAEGEGDPPQPDRIELGTMFELTRDTVMAFAHVDGDSLPGGCIRVPPDAGPHYVPRLFTRIETFGGEGIEPYESWLTTPRPFPGGLVPRPGSTVVVQYSLGPSPGLTAVERPDRGTGRDSLHNSERCINGSRMTFSYTAYGLRFASSFPLPELMPAEPVENPDVTVRVDRVPVSLPLPSASGAGWQSAPGRFLLTVKNVARYLVVENRDVVVDPLDGSGDADVRGFLLGSVLAVLLHARPMLVLHASVLQTARGAVLFMGRSGAGKSTLLAAFLQRGYAMLAEDKAGIVVDGTGTAQVMPGSALVQLTRESASALRYRVDESQLLGPREKYVVPIERFSRRPEPIAAAYSLGTHTRGDILLEPLAPLDRFQALNRHVYRRRLIPRPARRHPHFQMLGTLAAQIRVARVVRPEYPVLLDQLVDRIERDLAT
jgi:hypothetical protein